MICLVTVENNYYSLVVRERMFPAVCCYCGSEKNLSKNNNRLTNGQKARPQFLDCYDNSAKQRVGHGKAMVVSYDANEGLVDNTKSDEDEEESNEVEENENMLVPDEVSIIDDDNKGSEYENSSTVNNDEESEDENYSVETIVDDQSHKG